MARVLYSAFDVVPSPKGATTHIRNFVLGLTQAGHEVTLVTPRAPDLGEQEQRFGARHLRVGTPGSGGFLARALEFGEAVAALAERDGPFDVVHYRSVWSGLPLLLQRARAGHSCVFEANSVPSVELPCHYPDLPQSTIEKLRRLERTVLAESDRVICVSRVSRDYLVGQGAPSALVTVIPNGIDPTLFAPTPLPAIEGRSATLLYVGTLADWQGLSVSIDALPRILARRDVHLQIVGRGRSRQRKELLRRVRRLGLTERVHFDAGVSHEQVPALIAAADVCLAPLAYNERNVVQGCCPLKLLEYLACGRPTVASHLPVVRELVRDEREALLVPAEAPGALATAVLRLLDNPTLARRIALRGARRVHAEFTWQHAQTRLLALYDELLAARGTAARTPRVPLPA